LSGQITIQIDPKGQTKIEVDGVTGASCTDITKSLEHALGSVSERVKKTEFYCSESQTCLNTIS
jgi:hypothetical protein